MAIKEEWKEEARMLEQEAEKLLRKIPLVQPISLGKILVGIIGIILIIWLLLWATAPKDCIPSPEVCDGIDNDCDGVVDKITKECGQSIGECVSGIQTCENGRWGACSAAVGPTDEFCDGKDNDCDGTVDNIPQIECYEGPPGTLGIGMCRSGFIGCENGQLAGCVGQVIPHFEDCDGRDNDCDGEVDEDAIRVCYSGPPETRNVGECKTGTQPCEAGLFGACAGEVLPQAELCDEKDNDCDGEVDEGC